MGELPDPDTLRGVLDLATRAPSSHDSQPWRWRVGPDALHLFADPGRNSDRRDMLISCGASLHHCTVALAAMGWRARTARLPDAADHDHLASIEMTAEPPGELDVVLASAIGRRRTDRRRFGPWPVPWGDIALMGARVARAGVMLRQVESPPAVQDSSVIVALGTDSDDALSRLRAGEATSLVLLSATAKGLASCPVPETLETEEVRAEVRADVFGGGGHPQMMVRVGWAPFDAEPLPAAPRRPLGEVTEWANRTSESCPASASPPVPGTRSQSAGGRPGRR